MISLGTQISRLCNGHIPATEAAESMIRVADQFDRDADYVLDQCRNLQLGRYGLPQLHEACNYDGERCFKVLLAYEYAFVSREELRKEIFAGNDAALIALAVMAEEVVESDRELDRAFA
jgi:hypothetical protein